MDLIHRTVAKKVETLCFPKRIVKVAGAVETPENLLIEKDVIATFNEPCLTKFVKTDDAPTYVVLDLGKEIHGSLKIAVCGASKPTLKVRVTFGESVSEALSSVGSKGATNDHSPRDMVVGACQWSVVEYGQTGYRFVKIELMETGRLHMKVAVGVSKMEDHPRKGYVKTDDELLNRILETAVYTCQLNMQDGVIWDGIKRDRLVWSGDLNTEILTSAYSFGVTDNIKNSLWILKKTTPNGVWMNNIPTYSAWWVLNLCDYYMLSGDEGYFQENLGYVNEILRELDACVDGDGKMDFSRTGRATGMNFFFDWPTYEKPDAVTGTAMLLLYIVNKVEKLGVAEIDGGAIASLQAKLAKHKFTPVDFKQTLAAQVLCGGGAENAKSLLEDGGAKGFTTFMSYMLFCALWQTDSEKTLEIAKEYYGGMLSRGATTFWEDFDIDWLDGSGRIDEEPKDGEKDLHGDYGKFCYKGLRHSFCHGWASGIVAFAVEKLVGLEILETGFKKVRIKPNLCGLKSLKAKIPTPYGAIFVDCTEKGTKVTLPEHIELVK